MKVNYIRLILIICCLTGCLFCLSGCRTQKAPEQVNAESSENRITIGFSFDSFVIERWIRDRDAFVSMAQELGAQVNVQNANGDVDEQVSQIKYLIDKKVDVLAIVAIDGSALVDVVKEAQKAGIPVISYDRLIENAGTQLYVSIDNTQVGRAMAGTIREQLPEGGNIFFIKGADTDPNVAMVADGVDEILEGSGIRIVYSTYCENWKAELAFSAVQEGIEEAGVPDGIICGNDDIAGQTVRALSEQRLAGKIPVVAQDADLAACQRIVEGTQTMTVYKPVEEEARAAAQLAVMLARGENISDRKGVRCVSETISDGTGDVPYYSIAPTAVTRENMDEVVIDSGFHKREDVYLNVSREETEGIGG